MGGNSSRYVTPPWSPHPLCRDEIRGGQEQPPSFQSRVEPWLQACFGAEIARDKEDRLDRFVEEALELAQAHGHPESRVRALIRYVYDRAPGEPPQEVGGVMMTLAALCLATGIDLHEAGEAELARVWTKVETIRAKQAAKPKGSALPVAMALAETSSSLAERCRIHAGKMSGEGWHTTAGVLWAASDALAAAEAREADLRRERNALVVAMAGSVVGDGGVAADGPAPIGEAA